jgi:hypothetical protein
MDRALNGLLLHFCDLGAKIYLNLCNALFDKYYL